ncbi:hypothetical protein [Phyllobacterium sp. YR531]|uniref:hypothetical protein n=1 Tax=Phyllobacterium sp. YR531 TaxID=1144343 RepID=UPI00026FBB6C|nr:hypothetical protein [Phyllobacterium sp. YR531]EJM99844.1 hypothetical protein PMI41_03736 [Phyllobacterium sp. YR531]
MKTALIVMTLMGCDCDAKVCEYIKTADTGWTTMETCRADLEAQIQKTGKVDYPLITASCSTSSQPGIAVASRSFKIPAPAIDRPIETIAMGTSIEPQRQVEKRSLSYRLITMPFNQAVDGTASVVGRTAGWVRHYASL